MNDDTGFAWEPFGIETAHQLIIGHIAQINYHVGYIVEIAIGLDQQCLDILPHTLGLFHDIVGIHHLALVIDRGGT